MRVQAQGKRQLCAVPDPFLLSWSRMAANSTQGKRSLRPTLHQRGGPADQIRIRGDQANTPRADWLTALLHGSSARQDTGRNEVHWLRTVKSLSRSRVGSHPNYQSGEVERVLERPTTCRMGLCPRPLLKASGINM